MNEDFCDSNSMDSNLINNELQVRLMNLVLGESSDFERDQLQLLMEQRSEVTAYYRHIEHLHGLLCEIGAGELSIDFEETTADEPWRLSPDRRERVLAILNGKVESPSAKVMLASSTIPKQKFAWSRWWAAGVAVTAASVLLCLMLLPGVQSARRFARTSNAAMRSGNNTTYAFGDSEPLATNTYMETAAISAPDINYSHPSAYYGKDAPSPRFIQPGGTSASPAFEGRVTNGDKLAGGVEGKNYRNSMGMSSQLRGSVRVLEFGVSDGQPSRRDEQPGISGKNREEAEGFGRGLGAGFGGMGGGGIGGGGIGGGGMGGGGDLTRGSADSEFGSDNLAKANAGSELAERTLSTMEDAFVDPSGPTSSTNAPSITSDLYFTLNNGNLGSEVPTFGAFGAAAHSLSDQGKGGKAAIVPATPDAWRFGNGRDSSLSSSVKSPNTNGKYDFIQSPNASEYAQLFSLSEVDLVPVPSASVAESEKSYTVNVPDEGTILLGGIKRHFKNNIDAPSSLMMTVTPRIIIPEDEEEALGQTTDLKKELGDNANHPRQWLLVDGESKTKSESQMQEQSASNAPARVEISLGRKLAPAPSPEIASKDRDRVVLPSKPAAAKQVEAIDEQTASEEAFSTFSLHVSDVSFKLAHASLSRGQWPDAAKIRIEEFVNAIDYHDPLPSGNQRVACRVEQAIHPFLMQRNLLRVSMRTSATGRSTNTPLRLTLLLDNSGSMERPDRRQAVLRAFQTLIKQLTAADQVTLISFASTPRLLADKVPGNQGETLLKLVENLPSEGGTNIETALLLAREKAAEQQLVGAQNRIVMLTDGAVNLGNANPDSLASLVIQMRDAGIAFDAAGISAQDLNDTVLEALTRQGDGRYYLLDSAEAAGESFAAQIAGSLRPSAQNVKVQVEFNPQRVGHYKLLGYEKHRLNKEDFRNDQVDAAEMAAAEAGVAVYQFEIKPNGSGDVGSASVRFRDLSTGQMIDRRWPIPYERNAPRLEQAEASMQLAASAALFAAKLSGGPLADSVDLAQLQKLLSNLSEQRADHPRVQQLRSMIEQAKAIEH